MTASEYVVWVDGDPAAQGSKRLVRLKDGRSVMLENSKRVKPWRAAVADAAREQRVQPFQGDVIIHARVRFVRPQKHYRKDGSITLSALPRPGYADCDKLARAICDALAGIAYANDRQVAALAIEREWASAGSGPGACILIRPCPPKGGWNYIAP
jgi:Holliday junction resolvase RusA-like endonuclease